MSHPVKPDLHRGKRSCRCLVDNAEGVVVGRTGDGTRSHAGPGLVARDRECRGETGGSKRVSKGRLEEEVPKHEREKRHRLTCLRRFSLRGGRQSLLRAKVSTKICQDILEDPSRFSTWAGTIFLQVLALALNRAHTDAHFGQHIKEALPRLPRATMQVACRYHSACQGQMCKGTCNRCKGTLGTVVGQRGPPLQVSEPGLV